MGCHTAVAYALDHADAVAALVLEGPVTLGIRATEEVLAPWDRLADGLKRGGVEGFMEAYEADLRVDPAWRETALRITRERMERHRHPEAVARALREVPRSLPFEGLAELETLDVPALVVASYDEADPGHPYADRRGVGRTAARRPPGQRGAGQVPARLAGRPAFPCDRRLPGRAGRGGRLELGHAILRAWARTTATRSTTQP